MALPSATDHLEDDEDEDGAAEAATEEQIEERPAGREGGRSVEERVVDHHDEMKEQGTCQELAPRWHTALLVTLMLAVAVTGTILMVRGAEVPGAREAARPGFSAYLPLIAVQSALAIYVARIGRPRSVLAELLGRGWGSSARAVTDVLLAATLWLVIVAGELAWRAAFGASDAVSMLPRSLGEKAGWVVVAAVVGMSEELVYRGYLQTQLAGFGKSIAMGIVGQAVLFGAAHAAQGGGAAARFAVYGALFGLLAFWRKSLWPGILCHVWTDVASSF